MSSLYSRHEVTVRPANGKTQDAKKVFSLHVVRKTRQWSFENLEQVSSLRSQPVESLKVVRLE